MVSLSYSGLQLADLQLFFFEHQAVHACGRAQALLLYFLHNHMPHDAIRACTPGKACAAK